MEQDKKIINWLRNIWYNTEKIVKRVGFVRGRMSYIGLRGPWYNIIVLNEPATNEKKSVDENGSFYEELEEAFCHFPNYCMKIQLGYLMRNLERGYFQNEN
jgi:hypothetical protein